MSIWANAQIQRNWTMNIKIIIKSQKTEGNQHIIIFKNNLNTIIYEDWTIIIERIVIFFEGT